MYYKMYYNSIILRGKCENANFNILCFCSVCVRNVFVNTIFKKIFDRDVSASTVTETSFYIVVTPEDDSEECEPLNRLSAAKLPAINGHSEVHYVE